jgi:hypothetical protein
MADSAISGGRPAGSGTGGIHCCLSITAYSCQPNRPCNSEPSGYAGLLERSTCATENPRINSPTCIGGI